jgi:hypothetical protein
LTNPPRPPASPPVPPGSSTLSNAASGRSGKVEPRRFDTMPSSPSLRAWRNTTSPGSSLVEQQARFDVAQELGEKKRRRGVK